MIIRRSESWPRCIICDDWSQAAFLTCGGLACEAEAQRIGYRVTWEFCASLLEFEEAWRHLPA
jgi:hypothetical protein